MFFDQYFPQIYLLETILLHLRNLRPHLPRYYAIHEDAWLHLGASESETSHIFIFLQLFSVYGIRPYIYGIHLQGLV